MTMIEIHQAGSVPTFWAGYPGGNLRRRRWRRFAWHVLCLAFHDANFRRIFGLRPDRWLSYESLRAFS